MLHQLENYLLEAFEEELTKESEPRLISALSEIESVIPMILQKCKNRINGLSETTSGGFTSQLNCYSQSASHGNKEISPHHLNLVLISFLRQHWRIFHTKFWVLIADQEVHLAQEARGLIEDTEQTKPAIRLRHSGWLQFICHRLD